MPIRLSDSPRWLRLPHGSSGDRPSAKVSRSLPCPPRHQRRRLIGASQAANRPRQREHLIGISTTSERPEAVFRRPRCTATDQHRSRNLNPPLTPPLNPEYRTGSEGPLQFHPRKWLAFARMCWRINGITVEVLMSPSTAHPAVCWAPFFERAPGNPLFPVNEQHGSSAHRFQQQAATACDQSRPAA